jgi:hypothetical protein
MGPFGRGVLFLILFFVAVGTFTALYYALLSRKSVTSSLLSFFLHPGAGAS